MEFFVFAVRKYYIHFGGFHQIHVFTCPKFWFNDKRWGNFHVPITAQQ